MEQLGIAHSVEDLPLRFRNAGEIDHRRIHVNRSHDCFAHAGRLDLAPPRPHHRYARAAFIQRPFAISQRCVHGWWLLSGPLPPPGQELALVLLRRLGLRSLAPARIFLLRKILGVVLLVPPRSMNAIAPEVEKKRPAFARGDKLHRLCCLTIDNILPLRAVGDRADASFCRRITIGQHSVRGKIFPRRPWVRMAVKRHIKSLLLRPVRLCQSQVPFANVRCAIPRTLQSLRQGDLRWLQVVLALRQQHRCIRRGGLRQKHMPLRLRWLVPAGRRDPMPRRILAAQNAPPCRRAEWLRIRIRKPHRPLRKLVDVGRFVVLRSIHAAVHPSHVIS